MTKFAVGESITDMFRHHDGQTGLVDGDFTKSLYKDGTSSSDTVTVTEVGSGFYKVSFTPSTYGLFNLDVVETADDSVRFQGEYEVSAEEQKHGAREDSTTDGTGGSSTHFFIDSSLNEGNENSGYEVTITSGSASGERATIIGTNPLGRTYVYPPFSTFVPSGVTFRISDKKTNLPFILCGTETSAGETFQIIDTANLGAGSMGGSSFAGLEGHKIVVFGEEQISQATIVWHDPSTSSIYLDRSLAALDGTASYAILFESDSDAAYGIGKITAINGLVYTIDAYPTHIDSTYVLENREVTLWENERPTDTTWVVDVSAGTVGDGALDVELYRLPGVPYPLAVDDVITFRPRKYTEGFAEGSGGVWQTNNYKHHIRTQAWVSPLSRWHEDFVFSDSQGAPTPTYVSPNTINIGTSAITTDEDIRGATARLYLLNDSIEPVYVHGKVVDWDESTGDVTIDKDTVPDFSSWLYASYAKFNLLSDYESRVAEESAIPNAKITTGSTDTVLKITGGTDPRGPNTWASNSFIGNTIVVTDGSTGQLETGEVAAHSYTGGVHTVTLKAALSFIPSLDSAVRLWYGGNPDKIANAVWNKQTSDHEIAGSFGEKVGKKLLTLAKFIGLK